jgi:hypothetical protein
MLGSTGPLSNGAKTALRIVNSHPKDRKFSMWVEISDGRSRELKTFFPGVSNSIHIEGLLSAEIRSKYNGFNMCDNVMS